MAHTENVRVEIESEIATSSRPARVLVYEGDRLVEEITAEVELKQGADDGYYHCVTLKKVKQQPKLTIDQGRVYEEVSPGVKLHRRDLEDGHDTNI